MDQKPLMLNIRQTQKEWINYMRRIAQSLGIPEPYRLIIMFLHRHPGCTQKEIAEYLCQTGASVSHTVTEMEQNGYIRRETDPQDQRCLRLNLTEQGQAASDKIRDRLHKTDAMITGLITPEKEQEMISLLAKIREAIAKEG